MANVIRVSSDNMKRDFEDMKSRIDKLVSNGNEIIDLVNEMNQYYEGPAYETFKQTMSNGINQLDELMAFWNKYVESFREADKRYKDIERKVYEEVRGVKTRV